MTARPRKKKVGGKRKGAGRPRKADSKTEAVNIRLEPERRAQLDRVAAAAGTGPSTWAYDTVVAGLDAAETAAGASVVRRLAELPDAEPPAGYEERAVSRARKAGTV